MTKGKLDLFKSHPQEYRASKSPIFIETRPAKYLTISGKGEPGQTEFIAFLEALYTVAFAVKAESRARGKDYVVCKLEGLWWTRDLTADFKPGWGGRLNWKLMIRTPDFVTPDQLDDAASPLLVLKKGPEIKKVVLERIHEGTCVQALHTGPYAKEKRTLDKMQRVADEKGFCFNGLHHEIYLSDPRRVPEERLRTLLRMPVARRMKKGDPLLGSVEAKE